MNIEFENNAYFWQKLDTLFLSSEIEIARPKMTRHPKYLNLIYPVDYGYLKDTGTQDRRVSLFRGSLKQPSIQTIVVLVDILKKDLEVKVLVGCDADEELQVFQFLNQTEFQKVIVARRGTTIPPWASEE